MLKLILYTRDDCHLCDEAKAALAVLHGSARFEVEERDVDDQAQWVAAYGDDVPVGVVGEDKVFKHRVDPQRLRKALRARGA